MNKNFALKIVLLAFCATVESGIVTINFPDDNFNLRSLNGALQLSTKNNQVQVKTPNSKSAVYDFSSIAIRNSGNNDPSPSDENNGRVANNDQLLLKGSKLLDEWLNSTSLFSAADFYLFKVTNTKNVFGNSVQEVGPFRFLQKRHYEVEKWSNDEKYVEVRQTKSYSFIGNNTRQLEEQITVLNVPLLVSLVF